MALIQLTATDVETQKNVQFMGVQTETREEFAGFEEVRNVLRLTVIQLASGITGVANLDSGITNAVSVAASFNGTANVTLTPGTGFGDFRVTNQEYFPQEQKGSLVFAGKVEYISISDWTSAPWNET